MLCFIVSPINGVGITFCIVCFNHSLVNVWIWTVYLRLSGLACEIIILFRNLSPLYLEMENVGEYPDNCPVILILATSPGCSIFVCIRPWFHWSAGPKFANDEHLGLLIIMQLITYIAYYPCVCCFRKQVGTYMNTLLVCCNAEQHLSLTVLLCHLQYWGFFVDVSYLSWRGNIMPNKEMMQFNVENVKVIKMAVIVGDCMDDLTLQQHWNNNSSALLICARSDLNKLYQAPFM